MTDANLWNQLLMWPIMNVLVAFYKMFEFIKLPGPLGWSVISLTILIRLLLYPLMHAQMKSAKKMQDLKPHIDALNAKHKDDKQAMQQAQLALYKEHGVNPAAGCLPLVFQMPVLIALYNVFFHVLNTSDITKVIDEINHIVYSPALALKTIDLTFLGINLGVKPGQWQTQGWWLLAVPVLTALLQWYQTKLMLPNSKKGDTGATGTSALEGKQVSSPSGKKGALQKNTPLTQKSDDKKEQSTEDSMADMQKQMALISPIMFGVFAFQFPLGLALYWNVFGLFGIIQQLKVNKGT